jgi:hypothetical protein
MLESEDAASAFGRHHCLRAAVGIGHRSGVRGGAFSDQSVRTTEAPSIRLCFGSAPCDHACRPQLPDIVAGQSQHQGAARRRPGFSRPRRSPSRRKWGARAGRRDRSLSSDCEALHCFLKESLSVCRIQKILQVKYI